METYKIIQNIINNENNCETNKESASELKNKLKKQTEQLKSIIFEMKCSLGVSKFSNANCIIHSQTPKSTTSGKIPNIDTQLKSDLYKYSGFYCTKCTKHEYIFHFSSSNQYDKENTFGIQLFKNKNKITLGKWLMPMPVNLNNLMSEMSINHVTDVPNFLKSCKHYIDCYFVRHKQFNTLMDIVSHTKNCKLQANVGYTQVILELLGVYNKLNDQYMHIIIYLIYHIDTIKPYKIVVDSKTEKTLSPTSKKCLKASVSCFKQFDLHIAFEKILRQEPFVWSKEEDEDSPLDMNNSDCSSSEGFLTGYLSLNEKSLELSKRKRKVDRKEKTSKRKKTLNLSYSPNTSTVNANSISFQNEEQEEKEKEEEFENRNTRPLSKKDSNVTELTPPVNKLNRKKLRQRKLEFNNDKLELSKKNDAASSEITPSKKKVVCKTKNQPVTSTPVHRNGQSANLPTSSSTDISDITVNEDNLQNMKNNINSPKNSKLKKGKQSQNNMPIKLLRDKIKRNIKSSKSTTLK